VRHLCSDSVADCLTQLSSASLRNHFRLKESSKKTETRAGGIRTQDPARNIARYRKRQSLHADRRVLG
jgi:hypothetical protein